MLLSIRSAGDVVREDPDQLPIPDLRIRTGLTVRLTVERRPDQLGVVQIRTNSLTVGLRPPDASLPLRTDSLLVRLMPELALQIKTGITVDLAADLSSRIAIATDSVQVRLNGAAVRVPTNSLQVRLTADRRINIRTNSLAVSLTPAGQRALAFTRDMVIAGQSDFAGVTLTQPVLLGITLGPDPAFRSAANPGGRIQQTNAADLEFVAIGSGQVLNHNLISHDAVNGTIIFDLQVPLWTPANDFPVRINYGGAAAGQPGEVWFDLPIRSGRLSASGTSFWYDRPEPEAIPALTALADEEADVALIDAMAASSKGVSKGNVSTWDRLLGGAPGAARVDIDTQFDWRTQTVFGFGHCVAWLPPGAGWLFWVMQTVPTERRTSLDNGAIWQEIIDGDHDAKYIEFGQRLVAKIDASGHPRNRFVLDANHEMNQSNDYRVLPATTNLYKLAMEQTIRMIRQGAGFNVRFCHRPAFHPDNNDQPGPFNSYIPNNVDVLALSIHPGADVTNQAQVNALIAGTLNPNYYGITNDLIPTALALGLPIAFPEYAPKFDQVDLLACPVANLFMTTFYNTVLVPNRSIIVCDCVWNQNIRDSEAYEGPGTAGDAQWRAMVTNRKTLWRILPTPVSAVVVGFAAVNALGQNGTTGGAGGPTFTVTTYADFNNRVKDAGPSIVQVSGTIDLTGQMVQTGSDKTITGVGSTGRLTNGGIEIRDSNHNIIISNITFDNSTNDAIRIRLGAHHIWVDHNDISTAFDGGVDVTEGADYVTVSWNHFHDQQKTMLIGHDDLNGDQDIGHLRVTIHHNWFDLTGERHPRIRFAEPVHVFNNYYQGCTIYGVASVMNAGAVIEGNYFQDVVDTVFVTYAGSTGRAIVRNNTLDNSGTPESGGSVVEPNTYYSYTLDPSANVRTLVMNGAGLP